MDLAIVVLAISHFIHPNAFLDDMLAIFSLFYAVIMTLDLAIRKMKEE